MIKKLICFLSAIITIMVVIILPQQIFAEGYSNSVIPVQFYRIANPDFSHETDLDNDGNRAPTRPINGFIDESFGVCIPNLDIAEVIGFDILVNGIIIASFSEEEDFIECLFLQNSELTIAIHTMEWTYKAYIFC